MYLPLFIDLRGKKALIIGFGKVGRRRAEKLLKAGAIVTAMDRRSLEEVNGIEFIKKELHADDIPSLKGYFLVVASTNDEKLNAAIARKAKREGILVNRVDDFRAGDVIFPAAVEREGKILSFTTLGKDPRLSKRIEEIFGHVLS